MEEVTRVSAADFTRDVGHYQDLALTQPVVITRDGRDRTVMISAEEYDRLKRRNRRVYAAGELPETMLEAIRCSEMDERHRALDLLLEDWRP